MKITVYGIPNCDTVRTACRWLAARDIDYTLHDVRADGLPISLLRTWAKTLGPERMLNRRSTSWRNLKDSERSGADDPKQALALIAENPTLLRRPVVVGSGGVLLIGFDQKQYAEELGA